MLLVLDNCEHVIEAAAALGRRHAQGGPGVRVLATSHERYAPRTNTCTVCHLWRAFPSEAAFRCRGLSTSPPIVRGTRGGDMNEFELTDADAAIVAEICENWTEFRLRSEFAAAREPVAEHNDMVKAIPPDRTVPMPGKMSRSATRPPFGLPEGAGSRPHLASVFQGRRKSNNIHASSGVIWGIPAKILP